MTRFELLKRIENEEKFVSQFMGIVKACKTEEAICALLKTEISEEHMKIAMRLGNEGYPLSSLKEMKCEQEQYLTPEEEIEYLQDRYLKELKEQRNFERNVIISLVALAFQCLAMLIMVISLLLRI